MDTNATPTGAPMQTEPYVELRVNSERDAQNGTTNTQVNKYKDVPWIFAFIIHFFAMIGFACYGISNMKRSNVQTIKMRIQPSEILTVILCGLGFSIIFSISWYYFLLRQAKNAIKVSIFAGAGFQIAFGLFGGVFGFIQNTPAGLIVSLIFILSGLFMLLYYWCVRHRIPFAAASLGSSLQALKQHSSPILISCLFSIVQIVWFGIWSCAMSGMIILFKWRDSDGHFAPNALILFPMISLFWTSIVISNIVHVTSIGVMSSWLLVEESLRSGYIRTSLKRACTTSFGSICFGSFILAVVRAIRVVFEYARNTSSHDDQNAIVAVIMCCIECWLRILEDIVEYFNSYAFIQVGIYGKGFITSAKDTYNLFRERGFSAIINDDLTHIPVSVGFLLVSLISVGGVVLVLLLALKAETNVVILGGIATFIMAIMIYNTIAVIIESFVKTLFVCWAQEPSAIARAQPEVFAEICAATQGFALTPWWSL